MNDDNNFGRALSDAALGFLFAECLPGIVIIVIIALIIVAFVLHGNDIIAAIIAVLYYLADFAAFVTGVCVLFSYEKDSNGNALLARLCSLIGMLSFPVLLFAPGRIAKMIPLSIPFLYLEFSGVVVVTAIFQNLGCKLKALPVKVICLAAVVVAVGFSVYATYWSIGCKYTNMDAKEINEKYNVYESKSAFQLYQKCTDKVNKNKLLGSYPAKATFTKAGTLNHGFYWNDTVNEDAGADEIAAFAGRVKMSDGKKGYIPISGKKYAHYLKVREKLELEKSLGFVCVRRYTYKELYASSHQLLLNPAVRLYQAHDLFGYKTYPQRKAAKQKADSKTISLK